MNIISFFSGLGFLDLGFEAEGFRTIFVNEIHQPFVDAYRYSRAMSASNAIPLISTQSIEILLDSPNKEFDALTRRSIKTELTLFIGGPPCPDFSIGGKNRGHRGENGRLSKTYIDIICKYKPQMFLFENVKGLLRTKKHRDFYESLKNQLVKNGYCLTDRLTNALEFGVAQDRDRILLIGVRCDIADLLGQSENLTFDWTKEMKYANFEKSGKKLPDDLTVSYWFKKNKVESHPNNPHCFTPRAALEKFKIIKEGDDSRKSSKRLHRLRYSPTAAYGNNEVHIHPTEARRISAAEALAIQSLPRAFKLPPNMTLTNMFKGIGNGVPYLLSKGIARTIKSEFISKLPQAVIKK